MPSDFPRLRYVLPKVSKGKYTFLVKTIRDTLKFDISDVARFRLHVLNFYYKYGYTKAIDAFGVKKSTLYDWKKSFEDSGKKLVSLVPKSTRPHRTRTMTMDWRLVEFIRELREKYGSISKYKIKPFLDEYAKELGVESYSETKIGKVIKRRNFFFEKGAKPKRKRRLPLITRLKKSPKEKKPGYIEMDSITLYVLGKKYYFICAIDVVTKFAWCKLVKSLSSKQAKSALIEFRQEYRYKVRAIQTDNGSEFLKHFHKYLEEEKIKHEFAYPRSPKVNGVVERFNRTIQEEFITGCDEIYADEKEKFNQKLVKYLMWHNYKRPHHSLNLKAPYEHLKEFL